MTSVWFCELAPPETYVPLLGGAVAAGAIILGATVTNSCALSNRRRLVVATAAFCAAFQVGHFFEHGTQVAGFTHTTDDVTLTWWAEQIAYGYAWLLNRSPHVGAEAMHFFGDWVYTAGWVAWRRLHPREGVGKIGSRFQYLHQAEHCLLFPTAYFLGQPWGVTTLAANGPPWLRISIHFFLNLFGSILWVVSAARVWRGHGLERRRLRRPSPGAWRWSTPLPGVPTASARFAASGVALAGTSWRFPTRQRDGVVVGDDRGGVGSERREDLPPEPPVQ